MLLWTRWQSLESFVIMMSSLLWFSGLTIMGTVLLVHCTELPAIVIGWILVVIGFSFGGLMAYAGWKDITENG